MSELTAPIMSPLEVIDAEIHAYKAYENALMEEQRTLEGALSDIDDQYTTLQLQTTFNEAQSDSRCTQSVETARDELRQSERRVEEGLRRVKRQLPLVCDIRKALTIERSCLLEHLSSLLVLLEVTGDIHSSDCPETPSETGLGGPAASVSRSTPGSVNGDDTASSCEESKKMAECSDDQTV